MNKEEQTIKDFKNGRYILSNKRNINLLKKLELKYEKHFIFLQEYLKKIRES